MMKNTRALQAICLAVLGLMVLVDAQTPADAFAAGPLDIIGVSDVAFAAYLLIRSRRG
jgi:hypothetical protein